VLCFIVFERKAGLVPYFRTELETKSDRIGSNRNGSNRIELVDTIRRKTERAWKRHSTCGPIALSQVKRDAERRLTQNMIRFGVICCTGFCLVLCFVLFYYMVPFGGEKKEKRNSIETAIVLRSDCTAPRRIGVCTTHAPINAVSSVRST